MKCGEARTFLSEIGDRQEVVAPIAAGDLTYLSSNGYILSTTKEDYDKESSDVSRLGELTALLETEEAKERQEASELAEDLRKEHSFSFHFENSAEKEGLRQRIQTETAEVTDEESKLGAMEANVNELIQKKSTIDRMVPYGGQYLSLSDLGTVVLKDLNIRNYRLTDEEFPDFVAEIKSTYSELRSIADRASYYVNLLRSKITKIKEEDGDQAETAVGVSSLFWSEAIGLAKLQGDPNQIGQRFDQAFDALNGFDSTTPNKLMAAEIMTALASEDLSNLVSVLKQLDKQLKGADVPKELSAGVAATLLAGRRYDGTYPLDKFGQFRRITPSFEAAAILSVMNVDFEPLSAKFQSFRSTFTSWGYMASEDTEVASAFLAIGELEAGEVQEKLKYIIEQLQNYLAYPLVAAAILASIPVFESHEVLDLMEKAVTLLFAYSTGLERSELVALAVRMIHGVRNELVKRIDPTANITQTPMQFTYAPRLFLWYFPVIVAHSSYHATFSGMGGFHPAHSHGVGGFAG